MTREEFVAQLERGTVQTAGLPVTSSILRWTADQLKRGEPPWWKLMAKAWEKRPFVAWAEAWGLYLSALHFEALSDADSPLVPYFPSCGGTAEADPASGLARFFAAPPPTFFDHLRARHRRSYIAARAALWVSPAMLYFQRKRGLSFYLVEANAGAGLNIAADLVTKQKGFDSELIAARIGLDPAPLDLTDLIERRWLTAGIWPDNVTAIAELDNAVEIVQKRTLKESMFLQLAPCPADKAAAFVAKNVPAGDQDVGLLFFNTATTGRMTDPEYADYTTAMTDVLKSWGDRGLWVEVENVRGETFSTTYQLRAHRFLDGSLRSCVMASFDVGSAKHVYNDAAAVFLDVK
jgi:hypothetical protein